MSHSNIEFVFGREGEKQMERDSYCRNVKLVYMSTCTPNTLCDFLALSCDVSIHVNTVYVVYTV